MFRRPMLPIRRRTPACRPCTRLGVERLEDRTVPATISVADATLNELAAPTFLVPSGSGGLNNPNGLTLGPDGDLYVVSSATNNVLRYNAPTGQIVSTFIATGAGGLSNPYGVTFGPDGNLYVASQNTDAVLCYQGPAGAAPGA